MTTEARLDSLNERLLRLEQMAEEVREELLEQGMRMDAIARGEAIRKETSLDAWCEP